MDIADLPDLPKPPPACEKRPESTCRAILYARFSPRPDADSCESVAHQLADLREYCEIHHHRVGGEYSDEAMSGADADRLGLYDAVASLRRGDVLLVRTWDRLFRDTMRALLMIDNVERVGARVMSITEPDFNEDPAVGNMVRAQLLIVAQFQRERTKAATRIAMRRHQTIGRRMSYIPPYGWDLDPDSAVHKKSGLPSGMTPNEDELKVVRWMVVQYQNGHSSSTLARILNSRGIACRGGKWWPTSILRILHREGVKVRPRQA